MLNNTDLNFGSRGRQEGRKEGEGEGGRERKKGGRVSFKGKEGCVSRMREGDERSAGSWGLQGLSGTPTQAQLSPSAAVTGQE